jgi:hypothetical protein
MLGIAVVGTFLGATALLAYGVLETVALIDTVLAAWSGGLEHSAEAPPLLVAIAAVDSLFTGIQLAVMPAFHR